MYQREPVLVLANGKFVTLDPRGRICPSVLSTGTRQAAPS